VVGIGVGIGIVFGIGAEVVDSHTGFDAGKTSGKTLREKGKGKTSVDYIYMCLAQWITWVRRLEQTSRCKFFILR
jgi:hypothetical protein